MKKENIKYFLFALIIILYYLLPIFLEKLLKSEQAYASKYILYDRYIVLSALALLLNGILIGLLSRVDITKASNKNKMMVIKIALAILFILLFASRFVYLRVLDFIVPARGSLSGMMWLTLSGYLLVSAFVKRADN